MTADIARARPKGQRYNGGIRDLEDLRCRCVIDEDTGCWHLRRADGREIERGPKVTPSVNIWDDGPKRRAARPLSWEWANGRAVREGFVVSNLGRCGCFDCINPGHLRELSRKAHGIELSKSGLAKTLKKRVSAVRNTRSRSTTKLTEELAQWARESDQTQHAIAHGLGVAQSIIWQIKAGVSWRPMAAHGSSVFSLGGGL